MKTAILQFQTSLTQSRVASRFLQAAKPATRWDARQVRTWMQSHVKEYVDRKTGEANTTQMAEAAADKFDLYEDRRDYVIPEALFDLAVDVADRAGHGIKLASVK